MSGRKGSCPSTRPTPVGALGRAAPAIAAIAFLATGCGRGGPPAEAPAPAQSCVVPAGPGASADSAARQGPGAADEALEIGAVHPVDPEAAPVPRNPDEAFLFRHLYGTLTRIDCTGRPYPDLASGWRSGDGDRRWTFVLRDDVRFWDGEPVRAVDVAVSWNEAERAGRDPWGDADPLAVEVAGADRVTVVFARPRPDAPRLLARPALAVVRRDEAAEDDETAEDDGAVEVEPAVAAAGEAPPGWAAVGAGPYRVAGGSGETLELRRATDHPRLPARLLMRVEPGADPRDLLDRGVDFVVTGDPETLDYADLRPELSTRALPWSRTYTLAVPVGERRTAGTDTTPVADTTPATDAPAAVGAMPLAFLDALAREGVRAEARAAAASCGSVGPGPRVGRILYPREDPTARELAQRLVALATAPSGSGEPTTERGLRALGLPRPSPELVAAPVDPSDVPPSLRGAAGEGRGGGGAEGDGAAYVLAADRRPGRACSVDDGAADGGYRIVPLIETRRRIVTRSALPRMVMDGDGTPVFAPAPPGGR